MLQESFFKPDSDWSPPTSFPNLTTAKEIAIDLETYDPLLLTASSLRHPAASINRLGQGGSPRAAASDEVRYGRRAGIRAPWHWRGILWSNAAGTTGKEKSFIYVSCACLPHVTTPLLCLGVRAAAVVELTSLGRTTMH